MIAPADRELLLAYIEGELDAQAEARLHSRLKTEPELAQELICLARTESILREWAQAMQLAAEAATDPIPQLAPAPHRRFPWAWLLGVGVLAASLLILWSAGIFTPATAVAPVDPASATPVALAQIIEAAGQVELLNPAGQRSLARPQQDIAPGQTLQVGGDGSRASIQYPDGSRLDLTAGTTVRLEGGPGTSLAKQVILIDGYVFAEVKPQPEGQPLVLTTPHAIIRVPGTRFSSATQQDTTRVELDEGRLQVVRTSDGKSIDVTEGLYAIITRHEPALMSEPLPPRVSKHRDVIKHGKGPIECIAFSPDSNLLAISSWDGSLLLWDAKKQQPWREWKAHNTRIRGIAWLPGSKLILTAGMDRKLKVWDTFTGEDKSPPFKLRHNVDCLALSPDGKTVAVAHAMSRGTPGNEQVRLYDLTTGQEVGRVLGHNRPIGSLAYLPDGETLATAGEDGLIKLWSVKTQKELATLRGHVGQLNTVAADPEGRTLASGGRDGTIKVWDVATRSEIRSLPGHPREVRSVAFSPDGTLLASCGTDGAARLWDLHTGQELMHLTGLTYASPSVAFSHDGQFLAASSWDPLVKVWDVMLLLRSRRPGL